MAPRLPRHGAAPTPRPDRRSRRLSRQCRLSTHSRETVRGGRDGARALRRSHPLVRPRSSLLAPPPPRPSGSSATVPGEIGQYPRRGGRTSTQQCPRTLGGGDSARARRRRAASVRPQSALPSSFVIAAFTSSTSPPFRPLRRRNEAGEPRRRCRPADAVGRACAPLAAAGLPGDGPRRPRPFELLLATVRGRRRPRRGTRPGTRWGTRRGSRPGMRRGMRRRTRRGMGRGTSRGTRRGTQWGTRRGTQRGTRRGTRPARDAAGDPATASATDETRGRTPRPRGPPPADRSPRRAPPAGRLSRTSGCVLDVFTNSMVNTSRMFSDVFRTQLLSFCRNANVCFCPAHVTMCLC